jgi:hypothetical protein
VKLDENFDVRLVPGPGKEGFDAATVIGEGLAGSPDETKTVLASIRATLWSVRPKLKTDADAGNALAGKSLLAASRGE